MAIKIVDIWLGAFSPNKELIADPDGLSNPANSPVVVINVLVGSLPNKDRENHQFIYDPADGQVYRLPWGSRIFPIKSDKGQPDSIYDAILQAIDEAWKEKGDIPVLCSHAQASPMEFMDSSGKVLASIGVDGSFTIGSHPKVRLGDLSGKPKVGTAPWVLP